MKKKIQVAERTFQVESDDQYLQQMSDPFDPALVALLWALVPRDAVVADIGANIGLTVLALSQMAREVRAFEPSPTTFAFLQRNLACSGVVNVHVSNIGFGAESAQSTITFAANNRSGGYVSTKIRPEKDHVTENIVIEVFDVYCKKNNFFPSFIKIDVEGFELEVLSGANKFIAEYKPVVFFEMNHFCLNVLHRVTVPDFIDSIKKIFPYLYAIDHDNSSIVDLYDQELCYRVMYEHVVNHRYPNIVGCFDASVRNRLASLVSVPVAQEAPPSSSFHCFISSRDVLRAAWRRLRHLCCFWRPKIRNPEGMLQVSALPSACLAGELLEIPLRVCNSGMQSWYGVGRYPVRLSYHWQDDAGASVVYEGLRTPLQHDRISPGTEVTERIRVLAPDQPGVYTLQLTLVQEAVIWFENGSFRSCFHTINILPND
ncbi:FkbM family methyltransferase [Desulfuromonas thiophila]|uniref:Methyltransferase, FkbM family n=1 Tax=Desulfuromonas thiophila TaxID=57664 RepID=A0A1G7BTZ8_9BACT|nr:FkbM family methyltransferase [Desulfuromonas thiophila]SDE30477.1 methyltransferase, FkbM family [Desulfuromonas thiophila]